MLGKKKLRGVAQIALSLGLLSYLIWHVGPADIAGTFRQLRWNWYLPAFLLFLLNVLLRAYRWFILLRALNDRPAFTHLVYLYFMGFFANNFIPSGFGGDIVKVVSLRQAYGRGAEALSSVLMDRLTGLMGSAVIALGALLWHTFDPSMGIQLPPGLWLAVATISVGLPLTFTLVRLIDVLSWLEKWVPSIKRVPRYEKVTQLAETVRRYPVPVLLRSLLTTVPFTMSLVLIQYSIARALSVNLPLIVFSLFVPVIAILNLLPISFNGLGVREGAYLFLFVPVGVAADTAVVMSLAFYFLRFGTGLVGGLLFAIRNVTGVVRSPRVGNL